MLDSANTPLADTATMTTVPEKPVLVKRPRGRPRKNPDAPRLGKLPLKAKKPAPKPEEEFRETYYDKQVRKRKAVEELPAPPRRSTRTRKLLKESLNEAMLEGADLEDTEILDSIIVNTHPRPPVTQLVIPSLTPLLNQEEDEDNIKKKAGEDNIKSEADEDNIKGEADEDNIKKEKEDNKSKMSPPTLRRRGPFPTPSPTPPPGPARVPAPGPVAAAPASFLRAPFAPMEIPGDPRLVGLAPAAPVPAPVAPAQTPIAPAAPAPVAAPVPKEYNDIVPSKLIDPQDPFGLHNSLGIDIDDEMGLFNGNVYVNNSTNDLNFNENNNNKWDSDTWHALAPALGAEQYTSNSFLFPGGYDPDPEWHYFAFFPDPVDAHCGGAMCPLCLTK